MNKLILASQSPRRKELLKQIGFEPICHPVNIDERFNHDKSATAYCLRLATQKAQKAWDLSNKDMKVLGSDTVVVFRGEILGKPTDENDAVEMLKKLSGHTHQVITAVAVISNDRLKSVYSISDVCFAKISDLEIINYVKTSEPMDKAGSYGIQGYAARWIKYISGSYSGIMGLPLYETAELLR